MCKGYLRLVSLLFVPAPYYTSNFKEFFIYLSPHFLCSVNCNFVHVYMQKGNTIVLCCGMHEEFCLPTNRDNVVSCIKTLSPCRVLCVSVLPLWSYINLNIPIVLVVVQQIFTNKLWGVIVVVCSKNKLWGCCYVKCIAVPSFMCQFW